MIESQHTPLPWNGKPHIMDDAHSCNCTSWCEIGHAGGILSVHVNNGIESVSDGGNDAPSFEEAKANAIFVDRAIHSYYPLAEALALILPMAKGYAYANPVGSNLAFIEQAESLLNHQRPTRDSAHREEV